MPFKRIKEFVKNKNEAIFKQLEMIDSMDDNNQNQSLTFINLFLLKSLKTFI